MIYSNILMMNMYYIKWFMDRNRVADYCSWSQNICRRKKYFFYVGLHVLVDVSWSNKWFIQLAWFHAPLRILYIGCVIQFLLGSVALCLGISSTHKKLSEISLSLLRAFLWQRFTAMYRGDFAEMVFVLKEIALHWQA